MPAEACLAIYSEYLVRIESIYNIEYSHHSASWLMLDFGSIMPTRRLVEPKFLYIWRFSGKQLSNREECSL